MVEKRSQAVGGTSLQAPALAPLNGLESSLEANRTFEFLPTPKLKETWWGVVPIGLLQ